MYGEMQIGIRTTMLSPIRIQNLSFVENLDTTPETIPRMIAAQGGMKPDAGSCSNEARDTAGTKTYYAPFLGKSVIENAPCNRAKRSGQARLPVGHNRAEVHSEGGSAIGSQPSKPMKNCTKSDQRSIVRPEVEHHLFFSFS